MSCYELRKGSSTMIYGTQDSKREASGPGAADKDGLRRERLYTVGVLVTPTPGYPVFDPAEVPIAGGFTYPAVFPEL